VTPCNWYFRYRSSRVAPLLVPMLLLVFATVSPVYAFTGKCVGVTDGDTITVMHNGQGERIRLHGIDAPERGQDFGRKAKSFVSDLVFKKVVTIQPMDTDRYGRTVGMVFVDGLNVNREIVKAGYAWVYRNYCTQRFCDEWLEVERIARQSGIGLWRHSDAIPPWHYRKGQRSAATIGPQSLVQQSGVYHGNQKSHVFHGPNCRQFNCKNCTVIFDNREEAIAAGFRPCGGCTP
jgi:micrococcal nuclease